MRMTAPTAVVAAVLVAAAPAATHAAPPMPAAAATHGAPPMPAHVADDAPAVTPESSSPPLASLQPTAATAPREKGRWYGWELILSDTLFLLVANDRGHETALGSAGLPIGLVGIVAAPPALHLIHGNTRRAAFGLLVRGVTVGLYSAAILSANDSSSTCTGDGCGPDINEGDIILLGMTLVALGGAITYVFIDDFFFSRVPVAAPPRPRATVVPTAYVRPGGGGLGLVGTF